jgi:hypothetical protein
MAYDVYRDRSKSPAGGAIPIESESAAAAVISFGYLPDSPLRYGWKKGYASSPDLAPNTEWRLAPNAPIPGSMAMELLDQRYAIDFDLNPDARLSTRLTCAAKFIDDSAMIFVAVHVVTQDGPTPVRKLIKFKLGIGAPFPTEGYVDQEWTLLINPESLGNGWRRLSIALPDAVERTWGRFGWQFRELLTIRLRGHIHISPIRLY